MLKIGVGDRVRFRTNGGWYNSGIIEDINENSCLIKVDTIGCKQPFGYGHIQLPYHVRVLPYELIPEQDWVSAHHGLTLIL